MKEHFLEARVRERLSELHGSIVTALKFVRTIEPIEIRRRARLRFIRFVVMVLVDEVRGDGPPERVAHFLQNLIADELKQERGDK